MGEYVSLHTHADTSLLDGYGKVTEYVDRTVELGQRALGLTDHGNLYGVADLINYGKSCGITPVPGCEFYVAPQNPLGARVKEPVYYGGGGRDDVSSRGAYLHLSVWAINNTGLKNLFKLSTMSFHPDHVYKKPRIDFDMLAQHSEGLIVATGCPSSEISTRLRLGQKKEAYEYASRMVDVFGDRMYVEVMEHDMQSDLEKALLPMQKELADHFKLPLLATNDSHYTRKGDVRHHEEMLASQSGSFMDQEPIYNGGKRFAFEGSEYYLKSSEEMTALFPEWDYPDALKNTLKIAEMAQDISLDYNPKLMPKPKLPEGVKSEAEYFKHRINEGFAWRFGNHPEDYKKRAIEQVQKEYKVIDGSNSIGYFLAVDEAVSWEKEKNSLKDENGRVLVSPIGPGRGSGAGVLIAYLLGITNVNPLDHGLIFERFMSDGRGDMIEVTYDDGTSEVIVSSTVRSLDSGEEKYAYQLSIGDTITISEDN